MTEKRKLTEAEKQHVASMQLTIERLKDPDHDVDIRVYDETDDEGQARMLIIKQNEAVLPPDWKPSQD